jgi:choline monooxygenase
VTVQTDRPAVDVGIRTRYQLPAHAYHDPAWYEREQRLIFGQTYNLVGYEHDLPEPGDHLVTRIGVEPVLVVRTGEGGIRAFVNMCRHRGMVLACESGHVDGRFRCPYHGWEFSLDGALERVPQRQAQFPDIDPDELGLVPLAAGRWGGMLFVHPGEDPMPFEEWLGDYGAADKAGPYPWDELVPVARIKVPLQCNWKLYIENHIDIYHLWYLHEESLGMYDHHALTHWKEGRHWGCVEPLRGVDQRVRSGMLPIPGVPESETDLLRANLLWPNVPMSTTANTVMTYQVVPTGPESCELDVRVSGTAGSVLESAETDLMRVLRDEDGFACEQMQAVVRSPRFAVGPLAQRHERPIHEFHQDVLEALA